MSRSWQPRWWWPPTPVGIMGEVGSTHPVAVPLSEILKDIRWCYQMLLSLLYNKMLSSEVRLSEILKDIIALSEQPLSEILWRRDTFTFQPFYVLCDHILDRKKCAEQKFTFRGFSVCKSLKFSAWMQTLWKMSWSLVLSGTWKTQTRLIWLGK